MAENLRGSGGLGLCSSPGGFMTKHGVTVLGATSAPEGFRRGDTDADQAAIDASALTVAVDDDIDGDAVLANTVSYAADGSVEGAPMIGLLDDGRRVAAVADPELLPGLAGRLLVGETVHVRGRPARVDLSPDRPSIVVIRHGGTRDGMFEWCERGRTSSVCSPTCGARG